MDEMAKEVSGPAYRWVCKKCASANEAHVATCATCGCPALVAPIELDPPAAPKEPAHFLDEPGTWWVFFPELPIAIALVLAAPVWAILLIGHGHILPAIFLLIGVGGLGYAAYQGIRANEKWAAYASIMGILIIGGIVSSLT
jgi:hypothetical protein